MTSTTELKTFTIDHIDDIEAEEGPADPNNDDVEEQNVEVQQQSFRRKPFHDQLPTLEDIRLTNPKFLNCRLFGFKRWKIWAAVSFSLVVIAVTTSSVIRSNDKKPQQPTGRVNEVLAFLSQNQISLEPLLRDPVSPQHRAAQFLADGDAYHLGLTRETARRFVERYVLTVLWYQLNGPQWSYQVKFMSPQDHCNWFDQLVTTSGNMVREGVLCNNDGYIIAINLGKQMKDTLINLSTSFFPYNRCVA